ncbi:MAG: hypothetical protein Aurels2KO_50550 [Aureliella sp.]
MLLVNVDCAVIASNSRSDVATERENPPDKARKSAWLVRYRPRAAADGRHEVELSVPGSLAVQAIPFVENWLSPEAA